MKKARRVGETHRAFFMGHSRGGRAAALYPAASNWLLYREA